MTKETHKFLSLSLLGTVILSNILYADTFSNAKLVTPSQYKLTTSTKKITLIKGAYATAVPFEKEHNVAWIKRFNIVQAGGVNDNDITPDVLKDKGILESDYHIGYDWMPAFYNYTSGHNRQFVSYIVQNKESMTLNPQGPFTHCKRNAYDWCEDYYYNYFDETLLETRVNKLVAAINKKGYNGVFFDWASTKFLVEPENKSMKEYIAKHYPKKSYLEAVKKFYTMLQKRGVFVVTNQAFRDNELLASVDYDMTESYITSVKKLNTAITLKGKGKVQSIDLTRYYPIYANSTTIEDSLNFLNLLDSYKKKYKKSGFKNFIYMNYLAPKYVEISKNIYKETEPKNAIYYGYAMGKLTDSVVYGEVQVDRSLERDEVYFYDLGKPLDEEYQKMANMKGYIRFFQKGFVLASNAYSKTQYLQVTSKHIPLNRSIYDAYNKVWLKNDEQSVTVKLSYEKSPFEEKNSPLGRVYLY